MGMIRGSAQKKGVAPGPLRVPYLGGVLLHSPLLYSILYCESLLSIGRLLRDGFFIELYPQGLGPLN